MAIAWRKYRRAAAETLLCELKLELQGAQEQVIGIKIGGGFVPHAFDLGKPNLRLDHRHYAFRYAILKAEDVVHLAFEAIGPNVRARRRVGQLSREPQALARASDIALKHIASAEVAPT